MFLTEIIRVAMRLLAEETLRISDGTTMARGSVGLVECAVKDVYITIVFLYHVVYACSYF